MLYIKVQLLRSFNVKATQLSGAPKLGPTKLRKL